MSPTGGEWGSAELVLDALAEDEREWVPGAMAGVWMRPLMFDTVRGAWTNIVRLRTQGVISRHAHPAPVHGYVIAGEWHYAERDWRASAGRYLFEPPGDVHTLIADPGESLTLFWITGALIELDANDRAIGHADVFTRIEQAAAHYAAVGLGRDYVRRYIR